ncbi:MAG: flagellar biosynthesis protein FliQ [Desulfotalea sp.]
MLTPELAVTICRRAVQTVLMCAAPMLLAGLLVGLTVSIFQAATQINEQTLSFIPKIVAVFLTLLLFGPWLIKLMTTFATGIFSGISAL